MLKVQDLQKDMKKSGMYFTGKGMQRLKLCLLLQLLLMTVSCYSGAPHVTFAGNLLEDPGFEAEGEDGLPKGWAVIPHHREKGAAVRDGQNAHSGTHSLKLSPNKNNNAEGYGVFMNMDIDDVRMTDILISGFARVDGNGIKNSAVSLKADKAYWVKLPEDTGGKFLPFSKTIRTGRSVQEAVLLVLVSGTGGSIWLDDLKVSAGKDETASAGEKSGVAADSPVAVKKQQARLGNLPPDAAILFVSTRDTGNRSHEIYAMDADGSRVTRITYTKDMDHFIMGMDRSRRYIITSRALEDTNKPSGIGEEDRKSLWVLDLAAKEQIRLTDPRYHAEGDSFSPDGQWIVFFMKLGDKAPTDIYKIRRDGSELTRLTDTPMSLESDPSWSNDGSRIVFSQMDLKDSFPRFILKTIDVNGGDIKTVYDGGAGVAIKDIWPPGSYDARFSHDDQWIVFERAVKDTGGNAGSGIWHIFKIRPDGSDLTDLSLAGGHDDRAEYLPSFSYDGKYIVFGSVYEAKNSKDSHIDIFRMDNSGGSLKRLTHGPSYNMFPVWIPETGRGAGTLTQ